MRCWIFLWILYVCYVCMYKSLVSRMCNVLYRYIKYICFNDLLPLDVIVACLRMSNLVIFVLWLWLYLWVRSFPTGTFVVKNTPPALFLLAGVPVLSQNHKLHKWIVDLNWNGPRGCYLVTFYLPKKWNWRSYHMLTYSSYSSSVATCLETYDDDWLVWRNCAWIICMFLLK